MADSKKFQPPEWCRVPRSPEACKQTLRVLPAAEGAAGVECILSSKPVYTIGRAPSGVDVKLTGELASRLHAAVCQDTEGRKFLVDLRSTHGTFLDGQRLEPHKPQRWMHTQRASFGAAAATGQADVAELLPAAAEETESAKRPGEVAETEPALKKAKVDPFEALYGDLPEATVLQTAPRVEEKHRPQAIPPPKEPTQVVFLDIDGVLRSVHGRTDFAQNVRTMLVDGNRVALLGDCSNDNLAGIDFWPQALRALRHIVQKTQAAIVLSSDWRKQEQLVEGVNNQLTEYGIPKLFGQTPDLDGKNRAGVVKALHSNVREKRAKEIRRWLKQHPNIDRWVAIDDMDLAASRKDILHHEQQGGGEPLAFLDPGCEFVKCNPAVGLTIDLAKLAVAFLNGAELTADELAQIYNPTSLQEPTAVDPSFQGLGPTVLVG